MFWKRKQYGPKYMIVSDGYDGYAIKRVRDGKLAWLSGGNVYWEHPDCDSGLCWRSQSECNILLARFNV